MTRLAPDPCREKLVVVNYKNLYILFHLLLNHIMHLKPVADQPPVTLCRQPAVQFQHQKHIAAEIAQLTSSVVSQPHFAAAAVPSFKYRSTRFLDSYQVLAAQNWNVLTSQINSQDQM